MTALALILCHWLALAGERAEAPADPFDDYLAADQPVADGFDPPRTAGSNQVRAAAHGKVLFAGVRGHAERQEIVLEHLYYANHHKLRVRSVYLGLEEVRVVEGEQVERGQVLALANPPRWTQRCFRIEGDGVRPVPTEFIRAHRTLPIPQEEAALVLVHASSQRLRLVLRGQAAGTFEVGFGQESGRKRRRGDLRTPQGMYFVVDRQRGPFGGEYGGFLGGYWIKINYPNAHDAAWGRRQGLISAGQEVSIRGAWERRQATCSRTPLGGGIGFHGWIAEWDDQEDRRLSWGCVVLHPGDVAGFYDQVPLGTMVVIF
jgi:hypothetical protein